MFIIEFHGNYIPLQGIQYIIMAAKIIQDKGIDEIYFKIIGKGQTYKKVRELANDLELQNIKFIERVAIEKIVEFIKEADVCLGIFGDTDKTTRVIPNKVYEAAAMAKPIITADTPAIHELFTDRENILLCKRANSQDLADKILLLKNDIELSKKIANGAYYVYHNSATPNILGTQLKNILNTLI